MTFNRRQAIALLGGALSSPSILKSAEGATVDYVKVGSCYGAGFFDIPGCDAALHVGGFRVTWVNGSPADPSFAYSRGFDINGTPTSPVTKLGRPAGPTNSAHANLVTCQARSDGSGVNFFSAPKIGLEDRVVWSDGSQTSGADVGAPKQVSDTTVPGDYIQGLFSTTLPNSNLAVGYTFTNSDGSEVDARVRVCNSNGAPLFQEHVRSQASSFQFANNLVAGSNGVFFGYTTVGSGDNVHWVESLTDRLGVNFDPLQIKPPSGQFILGTPSLLPGPNGDLYTLLLAGTSGKDDFDLCLQHFDRKGNGGRIRKIGSQKCDNFGLIGNYPRCALTAAGNILALTDSINELVISLFTPSGALISQQVFIRRAARQLRIQALRMIGNIFVPLWIEIDSSDRRVWHAQVRRIDGDF